jgi:hypothetical protein
MPRSRSRTRRSRGKRRTRVGGQEDDGTAALHEFLVPYTRVTLDEACAKKYKEPKLFVWHSAGNRWAQMEQEKVDDLWDPKKHDVQKLCEQLSENMFELFPHMENTFKRALKDVKSRDVAGLYSKGDDLVVVVRTPDEIDPIHEQSLVLGSFLGGSVGGLIAGNALPALFDVGYARLANKNKAENKEAIDVEIQVLSEHLTKLSNANQLDESDLKPLLLGLQKIDTWYDHDQFDIMFDRVFSDDMLNRASKCAGEQCVIEYPWLAKN